MHPNPVPDPNMSLQWVTDFTENFSWVQGSGLCVCPGFQDTLLTTVFSAEKEQLHSPAQAEASESLLSAAPCFVTAKCRGWVF